MQLKIIYKSAYSSSVFLSKDDQNMQTHRSVEIVIWLLKNDLHALKNVYANKFIFKEMLFKSFLIT